MTARQHRDAAAAASIALAGMVLASIPPVLHLAEGACLAQPSWLTSVGLHLNLLTTSALCPNDSYTLGPALLALLHWSGALTGSGVSALLLSVLLILGLTSWARRTMKAVVDWFRELFRTAPPPIVIPEAAVSPSARTPDQGGGGWLLASPVRRRGPPLLI